MSLNPLSEGATAACSLVAYVRHMPDDPVTMSARASPAWIAHRTMLRDAHAVQLIWRLPRRSVERFGMLFQRVSGSLRAMQGAESIRITVK